MSARHIMHACHFPSQFHNHKPYCKPNSVSIKTQKSKQEKKQENHHVGCFKAQIHQEWKKLGFTKRFLRKKLRFKKVFLKIFKFYFWKAL